MTETPQELIARLQEALADAEANINIKADFIDSAINMHAADSQRIHELDAALATARGALAQYSCRCIGPMPDCAQGGVADCGWTARAALALIPATPPAKWES